MTLNVGKEIGALKRMTVTELRAKHVDVFGEETRSGHKQYLVKRIAWRIQAQAEGNLSERARRRAAEREPIALVMPFLLRIITYATRCSRCQNAALM